MNKVISVFPLTQKRYDRSFCIEVLASFSFITYLNSIRKKNRAPESNDDIIIGAVCRKRYSFSDFKNGKLEDFKKDLWESDLEKIFDKNIFQFNATVARDYTPGFFGISLIDHTRAHFEFLKRMEERNIYFPIFNDEKVKIKMTSGSRNNNRIFFYTNDAETLFLLIEYLAIYDNIYWSISNADRKTSTDNIRDILLYLPMKHYYKIGNVHSIYKWNLRKPILKITKPGIRGYLPTKKIKTVVFDVDNSDEETLKKNVVRHIMGVVPSKGLKINFFLPVKPEDVDCLMEHLNIIKRRLPEDVNVRFFSHFDWESIGVERCF